jgi:translation initiation factor 2B subunit (eIF-2B alpha/beta/delta family)
VQQQWATIEALADDSLSGAAEIAERAARALAGIPKSELPDAIETLLRGHPQMAPLWRLGHDLLVGENTLEAGERFSQRLVADEHAISVLSPLLPDRLLTISYSSTVKEAVRVRQPTQVLCMQSDPGGEGLQMAGALSAWVEASVISDEEALDQIPADVVVVGADAVTPAALVNKVKTRQLAEAALSKSVPCFAVAGETKFVPEALPISEPFEAVPLDLFTGIATPMGLLTPSEANTYASGVEMHQALRMLISRL